MSDERTPRRLYADREISNILRRATELQGAEGPSDASGLSLEELQQIAAEAGIDPRHVAAAVAELERGGMPAGKRFHVLGGPVSIRLERVVEGEVSEEKWEEMGEEIRRSFDLVGAVGKVGRSFEWTHTSRHRQVQVAVTSRDGQTRIRIHQHFPKAALLTFLPPMMLGYLAAGVLIGSLGIASLPLAASLFIGILGMVFAVMRFAFGRVVRKKEREAGQLLGRLSRSVAEPAGEAFRPALAEGRRLGASLPDAEQAPEESPAPSAHRNKTSS